jgi:hypothetical protein
MARVLKRDAMATNWSLKTFHAVISLRCGKFSATVRFSNRDCFDFEKLQLDEFVVLGQAAEMSEGGAGFGLAVVVDQPAGGEGHEDHADEKDERGEELETDGDEPGGG